MSDDDTPTTEQVLGAYLLATVTATGFSENRAVKAATPQFYRWLAAHDRALREQIARNIEVEMRRHDHAQLGFSAVGDAYAHAARIARGEQA